MPNRSETMNQMIRTGIVAVIRMDDIDRLFKVVEAISAGGIDCIEITMTTPKALEIIRQASERLPENIIIGVGSVLDPETANAAIYTGAEFVVGPVYNPAVIRMAHRYDKVCVSGAMTPTEILQAWENGADVVKVFPATTLGSKYFKDVLAPMPQVQLSPTGGVNLQNAGDFIKAGAVFLGVGSALLNKKAIQEEDWPSLTELAAAFINEIRKAREE